MNRKVYKLGIYHYSMGCIKLKKQVKLRNLGKSGDGSYIEGVTIPRLISEKLRGTYFNVTMSGDNVILESGCKNG